MLSTGEPMVAARDLSEAIRKIYHGAIAAGRTRREAFDLAIDLVEKRQPQPLRSARRAAAKVLAYEPYLLVG
ncbi:MAG: hypothetical protein J2P48_20340, partial [Alphaproteobacteria bacterium]|nr:hypothetical protein [Alphaproteobacteria bacterium]